MSIISRVNINSMGSPPGEVVTPKLKSDLEIVAKGIEKTTKERFQWDISVTVKENPYSNEKYYFLLRGIISPKNNTSRYGYNPKFVYERLCSVIDEILPYEHFDLYPQITIESAEDDIFINQSPS